MKFNLSNRFLVAASVAAMGLLGALPAFATDPDYTAAATAASASVVGALASVGTIVLTPVGLFAAYKMARRLMRSAG